MFFFGRIQKVYVGSSHTARSHQRLFGGKNKQFQKVELSQIGNYNAFAKTFIKCL